jgi:hypothetical protein
MEGGGGALQVAFAVIAHERGKALLQLLTAARHQRLLLTSAVKDSCEIRPDPDIWLTWVTAISLTSDIERVRRPC